MDYLLFACSLLLTQVMSGVVSVTEEDDAVDLPEYTSDRVLTVTTILVSR